MSILKKALGIFTRDQTIKSSDPYLSEFFGMRGGLGRHVDVDRASGLATAQACISVISQSLASLPLNLYRRSPNGGRERASEHPAYAVLHDMATERLTAFEAREFLVASLLITGNAYARITRNGRGQVTELNPIEPQAVVVERLESGRLRYKVTNQRGRTDVYLEDEILHLRYRLHNDGVMGLSPLRIARETFNLALAQQDVAGRQAEKGFRPEGVMSFPAKISTDKRDDVLHSLDQKINSNSATSSILVMSGGAEWKPMAFSARDAEFLESRKLTNLDICRVFGVPPSAVGITDNATYSNINEEARALVVRCLNPMARRIEQTMNSTLLGVESRKTLFIEHDMAGLLRGDLKGRYEAYRIGREWGWLSQNEIRGWENLSDIEGGDEYLSPLNMTTAGERDGNATNGES
ncbi:MAG: phage portal protein [Aquisalinus sp.]|nr:phage portal protein [Aquisalinus sp.]